MGFLFNETVRGRESRGRVFQSIPAFGPLVKHILNRHNLPFAPVENVTLRNKLLI